MSCFYTGIDLLTHLWYKLETIDNTMISYFWNSEINKIDTQSRLFLTVAVIELFRNMIS